MKTILFALAVYIFSCTAVANTAMYSQVASQYPENALSKQQITNAAMQGECLVQIKELTFKKKNDFDPISEWINYRSVSLLEKYSPCETLIMLEVANKQLRDHSK